MALYKQPGCAMWYLDVRDAGRRIRRSTGTADRKEAEAIEAAVKLSLRAQDGRATLRRMAEELYPETATSIPIARLWDYYEEAALATGYRCGETTTRKRRDATLRFGAWAKARRLRTTADVTERVAWAFLDASGGTAKTKRNVAGELSSLWRVLGSRGLVRDNPWKTVRPSPDSDSERHGRAFTEEEIEAIYKACDEVRHGEEWAGMVTVALYTGLRMVQGGVLVLTPRKTARHGIAVRIPIHPRVAAVFARHGDGLCFPGVMGAWKSSATRTRFRDILRRAGIAAKPGESLTFHCLRHTFATRLAEAGVPEDVRMQLGGWTQRDTARIYNHDETRARLAISALK